MLVVLLVFGNHLFYIASYWVSRKYIFIFMGLVSCKTRMKHYLEDFLKERVSIYHKLIRQTDHFVTTTIIVLAI